MSPPPCPSRNAPSSRYAVSVAVSLALRRRRIGIPAMLQVRTVDDVVRDRLLDWYDPPEDKKASAAVEVHDLHSLLKTMGKTEIEQIAEEQYHTALPPFGPLTLNEVIDVLARCKVHRYVAKRMHGGRRQGKKGCRLRAASRRWRSSW